MSVCKPRIQNLSLQRIVDNFLFGKDQKGYLSREYFTFNQPKKQLTLKIGNVKFNFQFEKELGSGTYGTVSSYRDPINNVYIAIKESSDDEDKITHALLNSNCNVLKSRSLGKLGKGKKNLIYIMEKAEGDLLNLAYVVQKPTGIPFILNIVEQVRRQMICIYELSPNFLFMYTDIKLLNILYKCDDPSNLNSYRVFLGDLGSAIPTKLNSNTYSFVSTYPPLPRRDLVGIKDQNEQFDFMSWQIGVLLLLMRVFLATSRSKIGEEISFVENYFYHRNLPSNPSFLEQYKRILRDTYDSYRTQYQIAKGFSFANYIDMNNRNSPYDKITEISDDSGYFTPLSSPSPQPQPQPQPQAPYPTNTKRSATKAQLKLLTVVELKQRAKTLGCKGYYALKKDELIDFVLKCNKKLSPQKKPHSPQGKKLSPKKKLQGLTVVQLKQRAKELGCKGYSAFKKDELIEFIVKCIRKKQNL